MHSVSFVPSSPLTSTRHETKMPSSSSSIYSYRPGGSLKFKGGESLPMKKKKKSKSKSSTSKDIRAKDDYRSSSKDKDVGSLSKHEEEEGDDDVEEEQHKSGKIMTEAEKKFEEIKRKRVSIGSIQDIISNHFTDPSSSPSPDG
jgi:protein FAM32A